MNRLRSLPGRPAHPFFETEHQPQLEMVRPSTALVDVPLVLAGYLLRQFRAGDEKPYDDLFHLAFEEEERFPEILKRTLEGGFFVVEHLASGDLVASALAWRAGNSPRHPDAGEMGWLVTDPSHTRRGLGTIVAALATNRLADEGYPRPYLSTQDFRLAAISIYLKLGWRPFLYHENMEARWRSIFARLGREFSPSVCLFALPAGARRSGGDERETQ